MAAPLQMNGKWGDEDASGGDLYTSLANTVGGISAPVFGTKGLAESLPSIILAAGAVLGLLVYLKKR